MHDQILRNPEFVLNPNRCLHACALCVIVHSLHVGGILPKMRKGFATWQDEDWIGRAACMHICTQVTVQLMHVQHLLSIADSGVQSDAPLSCLWYCCADNHTLS